MFMCLFSPDLTPQRALRDRLMSRGKNCLPTVSRQFLTRNYPRPNCLLKCLPNCLSPTREGFLSSFKINPAVRVIARQVRDKNCLAAIFALQHQSVSSGPLGKFWGRISGRCPRGYLGGRPRAKASVKPSKSWKNKHFGSDVHGPKARTSMTPGGFKETSVRKTSG